MKHCITKFLALLAMGCAGVAAYADAGLTIKEASYSEPGDIYPNAENRVTGHTLTVTLENTGDVDLAPGTEGYSLTLFSHLGRLTSRHLSFQSLLRWVRAVSLCWRVTIRCNL